MKAPRTGASGNIGSAESNGSCGSAAAVGRRLLVEQVDSIDSTNSELLRRDPLLSRDPEAVAIWLVAQQQTRGRGRRERSWLSTPAASLTASFAREVDRPSHLGALSLVAGIAIAESLAGFGADVRLKWPNDIHVAGGKAGGILCEARARGATTRMVIGCGLNLMRPASALNLDQPIAALFPAAAVPDRDALALAIGLSLLQATDQLLAQGFEGFHQRWCQRDLLQGRAIMIHHYGGPTTAVARGIDRDGALMVEVASAPGGLQRVLAEEVSVRMLPSDAGPMPPAAIPAA